jgi:Mn2+/Fe2+ NRAMP family transporter
MLMGFALLLFLLFVGGGYYLMFKLQYPITNTVFIYILVICFLSYFLSLIVAKNDARNIIEQDDV